MYKWQTRTKEEEVRAPTVNCAATIKGKTNNERQSGERVGGMCLALCPECGPCLLSTQGALS